MKGRLLFVSGLGASLMAVGQPLVHFDFVSHNEETPQWNAVPFYMTNRARLLTLADHFQANAVAWNMQSDWRYLDNVLTQETPGVTVNTGGKNILRWLREDRGVEMDPHAHESQYIYPDVVALMDSIGLPESKVVGGSIYNDFNGINCWMDLVDGQYGIIFPDRFWRPDYMMGGGTPNHVNDLNYYGFWNPQDTADYLVHDSTSHLRHIGVGCSIKIQDTSTVAFTLSQVNDVMQKVQDGIYPVDGFYVQTIFFEQAGLNDPVFYQKVIDVADSVDALVNAGAAYWRTLKQSYTEWETGFGAQVFQWECGQIATGDIGDAAIRTGVFPNPFSDHLALLNKIGEEIYVLRDPVGRSIWMGPHIERENLADLPEGLYLLSVTGHGSGHTFKIIKE